MSVSKGEIAKKVLVDFVDGKGSLTQLCKDNSISRSTVHDWKRKFEEYYKS